MSPKDGPGKKNRRRLWRAEAPEAPADPTAAADLALLRDLIHSHLRADRAAEAFQFALDRTCPAVGAALGSVFVVDGASELMRLAAAHAWPDRWRPWLGEMRVRVGFGPSGEAVAERRLIEVPDVFADTGLEDWQEVAGELGFRSLVSLPMASADMVLGAVTFYFEEAGARSPRVRDLLRAVADVMAAMTEKELLRERLRHTEAALESAIESTVQHTGESARIADTRQTLE
jgi:GAF domain-containing protein